jgi:hypothetical protein
LYLFYSLLLSPLSFFLSILFQFPPICIYSILFLSPLSFFLSILFQFPLICIYSILFTYLLFLSVSLYIYSFVPANLYLLFL